MTFNQPFDNPPLCPHGRWDGIEPDNCGLCQLDSIDLADARDEMEGVK